LIGERDRRYSSGYGDDLITVRKDGISIAWKTEGMTNLLRDTVALEALPEAA